MTTHEMIALHSLLMKRRDDHDSWTDADWANVHALAEKMLKTNLTDFNPEAWPEVPVIAHAAIRFAINTDFDCFDSLAEAIEALCEMH